MRRLALLLGILLAAAACSGDDAAGTAAPTTEPAPSTTAISPEQQEALSRVEAYFAAVNEGRIDDLEAILGAPLGEGYRKNFIFHGNLMADGDGWVVDSCEVVAATDESVLVECRAENTDPVFVAESASEFIAPFVLREGVLEELPWVPRGRSFQAPLTSYVTYLKTFHGDDYSLCDPFAQEGEFQIHFGLAKTPECGALLGPLRGDVAAWVEAGKPTE